MGMKDVLFFVRPMRRFITGKRKIAVLLAVITAACFLSSCGPEPGEGEETVGSLFGQSALQDDRDERTSAADSAPAEAGTSAQQDTSSAAPKDSGSAFETASETAAGGGAKAADNDPADKRDHAAAGATAAAGNTAGVSIAGEEQPAGSKPVSAAREDAEAAQQNTKQEAKSDRDRSVKGYELAQCTAAELEEVEAFLEEESSYGFLLSSYETPAGIDLNQVFYSGAGFAQGDLEKKEKELLLDRISQKEINATVVKVTQDQIDRLLRQKAGISYEESEHPMEDSGDWVRIRRYDAWYALREDTNRRYAQCTDAWRQGENNIIVHYRLTAHKEDAAVSDGAADGKNRAKPAEQAGKTGEADRKGQPPEDSGDRQKSAVYQPVYEAVLQKTEDGYWFCSNILWVQRDLIEAQSYMAQLKPLGEVFFAPFYPDTNADRMADVSFALIRDGALLAVLSPMEEGNIRSDRYFTNVDAVDFTDYNKDGFMDILTICSYVIDSGDGKRGQSVREARVYTGQKESVPRLDEKKTAEVNSKVQTLNITNVTGYLTGKTDGKDRKYSSWKEAYTEHIRGVETTEYDGFALLYLNDDRTPELVQVGATSAKGSTVVVYRNGRLEETWLNRRTFRYLEYENLLYSPSGVENLHYDTIYSIVRGRLVVSVQGYYGNRAFARVQYGKDGRESYDYYWDGGEVSKIGYRDGISFVFDQSRAKTCGEDKTTLLSAEEILEKLK
ncbi:MAG: hypothetical protein Q4D81_09745 [Eubacteriales bacterium]|nr:hypothetical protein [Eubacteriales bacterium]